MSRVPSIRRRGTFYALREDGGEDTALLDAPGKGVPAPPPSRTDNAILPQGSAESYKKGGSLSQGFSLALPPAAWLASNGRGAPARQGIDSECKTE